MANAAYTPFKQNQLSATAIDFANDDIIIALVEASGYTFSAAHDFYDDVPGGAIVAESDALDNPTITNGVFDSDDETITGVPSARQVDYVILVQDTGSAATSRLIAKYDTGVNFPLSTNGGDVTVQVNSGSTKWFSLSWIIGVLGAGAAAAAKAFGFPALARRREDARYAAEIWQQVMRNRNVRIVRVSA